MKAHLDFLVFTRSEHYLQHTQRQHLTYPKHRFWLKKSLDCRMPEAGAGQESSITCLLCSSAFLLVLYYTTGTFDPSCKLVLILKRTSSKKVLCKKQRICSSAGSDIMLRATWSSDTATHVADASLCLSTITVSRCPIQIPMENLFFFSFSQRQASHTHNPYLASTCWLAGCMGTAVSEVGKWSLGFFCTGYFLLPFSSSIGSGDCYRREEESKTAFWVT